MAAGIAIGPLGPEERAAWEALARGYKAFYETEHDDDVYSWTWTRLLAGDHVHGLGARLDGKLVSIARRARSTTGSPGGRAS